MIKKILIFAAVAAVSTSIIFFLLPKKAEHMIYGASFSPEYASYLGFDFKKVMDSCAGETLERMSLMRIFKKQDFIEKKVDLTSYFSKEELINQIKKDCEVSRTCLLF